MKKMLFSSLLLSSILLVACNDDSKTENSETEVNPKEKIEQPTPNTTDVDKSQEDNSTPQEPAVDETPVTQEPVVTTDEEKTTLTKADFLLKVENLQVELDAMPEKVDSDLGVTNAMKNYYGISYERFDALLAELTEYIKTTLPTEGHEAFDKEILSWEQERAEKADLEIQAYLGGTFAHVAFYVSLYEQTKLKIDELINEYLD